MVFGALQDQSAAHVGRSVVEVKDNIVSLRAAFGPKHPVDLLRSLHLIGQVISFWGTEEQTHGHKLAVRYRHIYRLSDTYADNKQ